VKIRAGGGVVGVLSRHAFLIIISLAALYPRLSPGGFVVIDDYRLEPCREAVHDYRDAHGIDEEVTVLDPDGAFWRRRQPK